jgi:hypothetical protein
MQERVYLNLGEKILEKPCSDGYAQAGCVQYVQYRY